MYRCTIVQIQKQLFKQENLPHPTFGPTQAFQSIKATLSKNKGDFNAHIPGFQAPISCFSEESLLDKGFWTTKQGLQVTLSGAPSTSQWWSHTRRPLDHRPGVSSIQMLQGVHLRPPPLKRDHVLSSIFQLSMLPAHGSFTQHAAAKQSMPCY